MGKQPEVHDFNGFFFFFLVCLLFVFQMFEFSKGG